MTTQFDLERRIELANKIEEEIKGNYSGGASVTDIGGYTIVEDGQDSWICSTNDYDDAAEAVISKICDGTLEEDAEGYVEWYADFCNDCGCIYSRIGFPSEVSALLHLELSDDDLVRVCELLGIDEEELEKAREAAEA